MSQCNKNSLKNDPKVIKKVNDTSRITKKKKNKLRRMQYDESEFTPLKMHIDLYNFNLTFPNDTLGDQDKDIIVKAIFKAVNIIEDLFEINLGMAEDIYFSDNFLTGLDSNILYWDEEKLEQRIGESTKFSLEINNYFVFFYFSSSIKNVASSKILHSLDSPLIGVIIFNEHIEQSKLNLDYLTTLMLHEFIHLLGFHIETDTFESIIEEEEEANADEDAEPIIHYYLKESQCENVFNYARKYFNCDNITQIELSLDEDGNIHWPSRLLLGELMTEFTYPEEQVLSGFTLSFLKDLGYIKVLKEFTGGLMKFGKNKTCDFFYKFCGQDSSEITFANEFYLPANPSEEVLSDIQPSCSSGRTSKTVYKLYPMTEPIKYEYYQNGYGGPKLTNYCPISEYNEYNSEYIYTGHCNSLSTSSDPDLEDKLGESFSNSSFCVLSSLVKENTIAPQMRSVCYEMICSSSSLTILIKNNYIVCPREGGKIKAEGFEGFLLCPDFYLICSGTDTCNNIFDCIEIGSEEKEDSFNYDYTIKTTQNSSVYNREYLDYGWELSINGVCPYLCMQCDFEQKCIKCAPHHLLIDNTCIYSVPHCDSFENIENNICTHCEIEDYFLALDSNGNRFCETKDVEYLYYEFNTELHLFKKCEHQKENCIECHYDAGFKCDICNNPYEVIDNGLFCGDISTKKYYLDADGKYKSCTGYLTVSNCVKCEKNDGIFSCLECETNYIFYHGTEIISCLNKNSIDNTMYSTDERNYYPCSNALEHCVQCNGQSICTKCVNGFELEENDICITQELAHSSKYYYDNLSKKYFSCTNIENCLTCNSAIECTSCKEGFKLVEEDNGLLVCQNIENINQNKFYEKTEGDITYFRKCSNDITNCDECSSPIYCNKCANNFAIIENDHSKCEDLSSEDYYYDTTLGQYKQCSFKLANCEKCANNNNDILVCKKCFTNFALKHENINECKESSFFVNNNIFFTNDTGINYYLCSLYSSVSNCLECSQKDKCTKCIDEQYLFSNNGLMCAQKSQIDNHILNYNKDGLLMPCSSMINGCYKCQDSSTCFECGNGFGLIDNDTCLEKTKVEENNEYYYNETSNRYISCSIIENCLTCDSDTTCTSCKEGFIVNNNKCQEIISNGNLSNEDKKLSTGAIIGIVFGCLGFLLITGGLVYFLMNKVFLKQNDMKEINKEKIDEKDENVEEKENIENNPQSDTINVKQNEVFVHTARRNIHN